MTCCLGSPSVSEVRFLRLFVGGSIGERFIGLWSSMRLRNISGAVSSLEDVGAAQSVAGPERISVVFDLFSLFFP